MADPNTRQGKRTPVTLKIKFKSETLEQFIERYAVDVSQGGIFIRTKEPLAVGTQMKFEFQLRDASPLIAGEGTVVWTRENDPSRPAIAPGMGVRFDKLAEGSQNVLERILAEKAKQAPSRGGNEATTKPPMFTDTPTRVAPAPVQEALGVRGRRREDSEQTPLPKPMPFHSDAEDFDERAFEEATKVRSLDELAAQTAGLLGGDSGGDNAPADDQKTATKIMPPDELAARRHSGRADSTLADPPLAEPREDTRPGMGAAKAVPDRDSAPGLPSPPETARPKMLDSAPRGQAGIDDASQSQRTKLGMEPAKAATSARGADSAVPSAVASEPSRPVAPKRPSSAPIVIAILLVVAAGLAGVWFFFVREDGTKKDLATKPDTTGSAVATTNPDPTGSAGSAVATTTPDPTGSAGSSAAMAGSSAAMAGSAGSATAMTNTPPPGAKLVDTVVASSVAKGATVEIVGTDQKGPAPLTAKLEKDKAYKAHVVAPGFVAADVDVKGGGDKVVAKLTAKPKLISVTTEPAGADILVDGVSTQKLSPADVELSAAQSAKARIRITLRRPGYRQVDQFLETGAFTEGDTKLTVKVDTKLTVAPKQPTGGNTGGGNTTTNNNGAGSGATTPAGTGAGSATPPAGGTTTPSGGTTTPSGGTTTPSGGTTTPSGGTTTPPAGGTTTPSGGTTTPAPKPTGTTTGSASAPAGGTLQ